MDKLKALLITALLLPGAGMTVQASAAAGEAQGNDQNAQGKAIYDRSCAGCHNAGVMNSPRFGDARTIGALHDKDIATLYTHTLEGYRGMPPKGGNPSLSEDEVKAAVDYLLHSTR